MLLGGGGGQVFGRSAPQGLDSPEKSHEKARRNGHDRNAKAAECIHITYIICFLGGGWGGQLFGRPAPQGLDSPGKVTQRHDEKATTKTQKPRRPKPFDVDTFQRRNLLTSKPFSHPRRRNILTWKALKRFRRQKGFDVRKGVHV